MIAEDLLARYKMGSLDFFAQVEGTENAEAAFYQTFLLKTDYVPNKIIEAQALGVELNQDYTEILQARAYARQRLSELGVGT